MISSEDNFRIKIPVVCSLNQLYGKMVAFAHPALMKNYPDYSEHACVKERTNVAGANAIFTITTKLLVVGP